jgi:hypothetical protein
MLPNHETQLNLTKEELEALKLRLEIEALQKHLREEPPSSSLTKLNNYLQKNIGQLLAIIALFVALFGPIFDYIGNIKKSQLITVNAAILPLLDSPNFPVKTSTIMQISTLDPATVAPFLLSELDKGEIDARIVSQIYEQMFFLNDHIPKRSFSDKILFLFIDDNQTVLENELCDHAVAAFNASLKPNEVKVLLLWKAYLGLIKKVGLSNVTKFTEAVNLLELRTKRDPHLSELFTDYLENYHRK